MEPLKLKTFWVSPLKLNQATPLTLHNHDSRKMLGSGYKSARKYMTCPLLFISS